MSAVAEDVSRFLAAGRPARRSRRSALPNTSLAFDAYVQAGIPNRVGARAMKALALDRETFARLLHVSPATLDRRNAARQPFRGAEADALYRVLGVLGVGLRVLGSQSNIRSWMRRGQPGLGGRVPLEVIRTGPGADAVCLLLEQIHHGLVP